MQLNGPMGAGLTHFNSQVTAASRRMKVHQEAAYK